MAKQSRQRRLPNPQPILAWAGLLRLRFLWLLLLLVLVLASGLGVVRTTHQNRFAFNELQELRERANQLDIQWGQLLIEQSTFAFEGRVEQKAREELGMRVPDLSRIVMVDHD